jgi:M6 family metalloprotease-like protein
MFREAVSACDGSVDFSRFDVDGDGYVDMLWLVHAGPGAEITGRARDFWSITSRATAGWNNGSPAVCNDIVPGTGIQQMRIDRFTILPELSGLHAGQLCEIGVFCHEFGHTLGLPDLYDTSYLGGAANAGPGNWSLMSSGAFGGDGASPESPSNLDAWSRLFLGWTSRVRPAQDTTLVLAPYSDGAPVVDFWFQGESSAEHFLIENRVRESFDRLLPNDGLIVYHVDDALMGTRLAANRVNTGPTPGLQIVEADGNYDLYYGWDHGGQGDPFPGSARRTRLDDVTQPSTRTFLGAPTNIALEQIARSGRNTSLRLRVRAPGWQPSANLAGGGNEPAQPFSPAARAAVSPSGRGFYVSAENYAGRSAILLRERPWLQSWQQAVPVDRAVGVVSEPTLARLPGDNLAVAWIERTGEAGQVVYRARILGRWGTARVLTNSVEGCFAPAIAADARGRVFLAWLEVFDGRPILRFMEFLYSAPYGQPRNVTVPEDQPIPPAVTAAGDGHAYVVWPDRGGGASAVWACRFDADSGLSQRFRLGPASAYAQPAVSAVVDSAGVLYSVWQVSPGGQSEIHFQRRPRSGKLSPRDTTIDAIGDELQNPRITRDPTGGLHVAYERSVPSGQQIRYKRWIPSLGWDQRATEVSDASDISVGGIDLLSTSTGNVDVTWVGFDGNALRLRERVRLLDGSLLTDVPLPPAATRDALVAGPNPLRAGQVLEFGGEALAPGAVVELLDASGRRVARVAANGAGRARLEPAETRSLPAGLYFARVRGSEARGRLVVIH